MYLALTRQSPALGDRAGVLLSRGRDSGLYAPQRPAIPIAALQLRLERDGWPGVARHSAPAIPIAALNLKAEATARFPDGCQLVDFELLRL